MSQVDKGITASDAWDSYSVKIMGIFDNYSEARSKLPNATEKSDLNSTDQEDLGKGKRHKKKLARKASSSSTESEDLCPIFKKQKNSKYAGSSQKKSEDHLIQLQDPPTFESKKNAEIASSEKDICDNSLTLSTQDNLENVIQYVPCDDDGSLTFSTEPNAENVIHALLDINEEPGTSAPHPRVMTTGENLRVTDPVNYAYLTSTHLTNHVDFACPESFLKALSPNIQIENEPKSSGTKAYQSFQNDEIRVLNTSIKKGSSSLIETNGFESVVLREINLIKMNQRSILEQLECLCTYINQQKRANIESNQNNLTVDFINLIPATNLEELGSLETKLKDETISNQMVHFLSKLGGSSFEQGTKLMLKKVLTDELAALFSFQGIRYKRSFQSLEICKIILYTVKTHVLWSETSDFQIGRIIANWLRHARGRLQNKNKNK